MFNLGPFEMALFGLIALMLFGKKLPEVARNFGATYRDLRRSLTDFQREFQGWDRPDPRANSRPAWQEPEPEKIEAASPKFVPPPPSGSAGEDRSSNSIPGRFVPPPPPSGSTIDE